MITREKHSTAILTFTGYGSPFTFILNIFEEGNADPCFLSKIN